MWYSNSVHRCLPQWLFTCSKELASQGMLWCYHGNTANQATTKKKNKKLAELLRASTWILNYHEQCALWCHITLGVHCLLPLPWELLLSHTHFTQASLWIMVALQTVFPPPHTHGPFGSRKNWFIRASLKGVASCWGAQLYKEKPKFYIHSYSLPLPNYCV